jgi:hypothetical protein
VTWGNNQQWPQGGAPQPNQGGMWAPPPPPVRKGPPVLLMIAGGIGFIILACCAVGMLGKNPDASLALPTDAGRTTSVMVPTRSTATSADSGHTAARPAAVGDVPAVAATDLPSGATSHAADAATPRPTDAGTGSEVDGGPSFAAPPSVTGQMQGDSPVQPAPPPTPPPTVTFWTDPEHVRIEDDQACPPNLWSIFPGRAPGDNEFERRQNEEDRRGLQRTTRQTVFVLGGLNATLGEYDFHRHAFPLDVPGLATCGRSLLRARFPTAFAFGRPRWVSEGSGFLSTHEWVATPLRFWINVPESEAPTFRERNHRNLRTLVAFRVRSGQQARSIGGASTADSEAGRLVATSIVGVQVTAGRDHAVIMDTAPAPRRRHR